MPRCDRAECRNIPVACEGVSMLEECWSGGAGRGGRGGDGEKSEWGLAVGVMGMSGSKI